MRIQSLLQALCHPRAVNDHNLRVLLNYAMDVSEIST
jgi:hypothetical protein